MKRHKFNIFPKANDADYARLRDDIKANGFDELQPIILFRGDILDGSNRQAACEELGVKAVYKEFCGTDSEAVDFMMRTNKRRNLNKGQWACIAAEADDLIGVIRDQVEKERRAKISEARRSETTQKIAPSKPKEESETRTKTAAAFNTNRTYVNQASKMRDTAPDVFEKVKTGKMTMQDANRAVRAIPDKPWLDDETQRKKHVEAGTTVIANAERDKNLIAWADKNGKLVRIDRGSKWGNPFVMGADGSRDDVCDAYRDHYASHKPSFAKNAHELGGKVLVCHCYPERCHGETLAELAAEQ